MKTKRLVINGVEDIALIEEKLDPERLDDDSCLIETDVSLISAGTELSRVYGLKKGAAYPVYPGYCSVGKILRKGANIKDLEEGDRVLFSGPHSSHQIYNRLKSDGGILYKLRDETHPIDGAFLMMCSIAMNGVLPVDYKLGDRVAVIGMGTLGMIVALLYQRMGADVIALEPVLDRAKLARKAGIRTVIDTQPKEQLQAVMGITDNKGVDIVIDASGLSACIETAIKIAGVFGQVVLLGSPRSEYMTNATDSFNAIHTKMLSVIGAFNRRYPYYESEGSRLSLVRGLAYLEKLLNQKVIDTELFISHIIKADAEAIMAGYRGLMFEKDQYTGVIIDWKK